MNLQDVTSSKHGGNTESVQANERAAYGKKTIQQSIYIHLRFTRPSGATGAEIAAHLGRPFHTISGRLSELKALKLICASQERRNGGSVLLADIHFAKQQSMF